LLQSDLALPLQNHKQSCFADPQHVHAQSNQTFEGHAQISAHQSLLLSKAISGDEQTGGVLQPPPHHQTYTQVSHPHSHSESQKQALCDSQLHPCVPSDSSSITCCVLNIVFHIFDEVIHQINQLILYDQNNLNWFPSEYNHIPNKQTQNVVKITFLCLK
jgi:hypothetical protein